MAIERTLCIVKPDAVAKNNIGNVLAMIEGSGLVVRALRMVQLTTKQAEGFYAVHSARPFFRELVDFMISGPVVIACLEGEDAVARYRKLMGATNPANADEGTIRKAYAASIGENAVHGSDSLENAAIEIAYYFPGFEF